MSTWTVNDFTQATSVPGVRVVHTLCLPALSVRLIPNERKKGQGNTLKHMKDAWSKDLEINMTEDQWTEA